MSKSQDTASSKRRHWLLRSVTVVTVAGVVGGGGLAYAAWQTTASGGAAAAKTGSITVTANSTAPTFAGANLVHPGSLAGGTGATQGGDLSVTLTNNNGYTLYIDSIVQANLIPASGSCPADASTTSFPNNVTMGSGAYVGSSTTYTTYTLTTPVSVPSSANAQTITIPNVLSMSSGSPNACQNVSLSVPVTLNLGTS